MPRFKNDFDPRKMMNFIQAVAGIEIYAIGNTVFMRCPALKIWYTRGDDQIWSPAYGLGNTLELSWQELLTESSQRRAFRERKIITDELRRYILPDCVGIIDWYLASWINIPLPDIPDVSENLFNLVSDLDCDHMYKVSATAQWHRYGGIIWKGEEIFADNLLGNQDDWWSCDENGLGRRPFPVLVNYILRARAIQLVSEIA